jgi:CrcB protein
MKLIPYLIIFLGSGLGGMLRHGVNQVVSDRFGMDFPFGILIINISGSLLLGLLAGYFAYKGEVSHHWQLFLTVGICGGYTTFSTFSQNTALLIERGQLSLSALYVVLSVTISVIGFFGGLWAMRQLN